MHAPKASNGHSARVRLELRVGKAVYRLAQIGGDQLVFKQAVSLPGTTGEVSAWIDEHEQRWTATWPESESLRQIVPAKFQQVA